jgi:nitroreductase
MDIREALYTTRAMRRVTNEPVPTDVQARILDAAIRAPSGGNGQQWRFLLVDDPTQRERLGDLYRECIDLLWATIYADKVEAAQGAGEEAESLRRMINSVSWAQENFAVYPLLLFAFAYGDTSGGSIFPAVWSAQLAARAEGVGSSLTSVLAFKADETREVLGVPDEQWKMACCVTFGYPTGRWGVPQRTPVQDVAYRNTWGTPVGFSVDEPLWP